MNNQFLIPNDCVDEDDLGDLVASIRSVTKADIYIEKQLVVTSDSPAALDALRALFGDLSTGIHPRTTKVRKNKKADGKKARGRYVKSWEYVLGSPVDLVGVKLSSAELSQQLSSHQIEIGAVLRHPKHGHRVVEAGGEGEPYVLVPEKS